VRICSNAFFWKNVLAYFAGLQATTKKKGFFHHKCELETPFDRFPVNLKKSWRRVNFPKEKIPKEKNPEPENPGLLFSKYINKLNSSQCL
jgi:hypothetical protein